MDMQKKNKLSINTLNLTWLLSTIVLVLAGAIIKDRYILHILITIFMYIILAESMRLILTMGNLNLAHAAFMGIGAYVYGILALNTTCNPWFCLLLGGLAAALIAVIVGYPTLRLKRHYFAFVSFALCELIRQVWMHLDLSGGAGGLLSIPRLSFDVAGLTINFASKQPQYYLVMLVMLLMLFFLYRLEKSPVGRAVRSTADEPLLAECVGINVIKYKVIVFSLACFLAGIAGAFYAQYTTYISPYDFTFMGSFYMLVYVIVGGMGSIVGPIVGTALLIGVQEVCSPIPEVIPILLGVILIAVMLRSPMGLTDIFLRGWRRESA